MDIKKFLKKMAQMANFQAPVEPVVEQPISQPQPEEVPGVIDENNIVNTVDNTQNNVPEIQQAPPIIQTTFQEWTKKKGIFYLNLIGLPINTKIVSQMQTLGYKFWRKRNAWSKQVTGPQALLMIDEIAEIAESLGTKTDGVAISQMQAMFGVGSDSAAEPTKIQKIHTTEGEEQRKITQEMIANDLERLFSNLNSDETQQFLEDRLSIRQMTKKNTHAYSRMNSMLIQWQNAIEDPETGERARRSGMVASKTNWAKYGRQPKEGERGMDIFRPNKVITRSGDVSNVTGAIFRYLSMNKGKNTKLTDGENTARFLGFLKSLVYRGPKKPAGKLWTKQYDFVVRTLYQQKRINPELTINELIAYLKNLPKDDDGVVNSHTKSYAFEPIALDMDQTEVIPGKEHLDPKPKMDAIRNQWLGLENQPNEKIDAFSQVLIRAAQSGKLLNGKAIEVTEGDTGSSGGYSAGGRIKIDYTSQGLRKLRTMIHEGAHEILHWKKGKNTAPRAQEEIDADTTAYIVMRHYGFPDDGATSKYLSTITQDRKDIESRLEPILEASNIIIAAIEQQKLDNFDSKLASSWYKKFKFAHYSEPEQKGEGMGGSGTGQFGERRLEDWSGEHRIEVKKMARLIKAQDWVGVERYKQILMVNYNAPQNQTIVDGIVSAAMRGQKF